MEECPVCDDSFNTEHGMMTHKSMVHGRPTKECEICGEVFDYQPKREKTVRYCSSDCQYKSMVKDRILVSCDNCGDSTEKYPSKIERCNNFFCSTQCRHNYFRGNNHPRYTGYTSDNFYGVEWSDWRNRILDKYEVCQKCGKSGNQIHHIIPVNQFKEVTEAHFEENLTRLCASCHMIVENNWSISKQKEELL